MISSFRLYSGRRESVPGGTETVGGEDVAEIGEAAVERGPAAEALGRERGDRAMRQRRAEPAILDREPREGDLQGVVVYSGSGLVGYGELVIVKHNDQWLSAYGHNRARQVNEGQVVKAGQQIAEMGRSGASRDMLHFEIRYNGKPVDPQQYLQRR